MADKRENLLETVLHDWHLAHDAKMVPFGGWDMPVQYATGIIREHLATRRHAGLFDVSHMGRFSVTGGGAEDFLDSVLSHNVQSLQPGEARYTFMLTRTGGGGVPRPLHHHAVLFRSRRLIRAAHTVFGLREKRRASQIAHAFRTRILHAANPAACVRANVTSVTSLSARITRKEFDARRAFPDP